MPFAIGVVINGLSHVATKASIVAETSQMSLDLNEPVVRISNIVLRVLEGVLGDEAIQRLIAVVHVGDCRRVKVTAKCFLVGVIVCSWWVHLDWRSRKGHDETLLGTVTRLGMTSIIV